MIRVLQVVPSLRPGGAERIATYLALNLDSARFCVAIAVLEGAAESDLEDMLNNHGSLRWHLGKRPGFDPRMFSRLARIFKEFRPSIVHTHLAALRYVFPVARMEREVHAVHTVHNLAEHEVEPRARWISRIAFRGRVMPVTIAREVDLSFNALYGRRAAALIPNGVPLDPVEFTPEARNAWRSNAGFQESDILFVSVARFSPQKNHSLLLKAFGRAFGANSTAKLLLVGDGELRHNLEAESVELGISASVHFLGVRRDIAEILRSCDVFALSSSWEGNPLCIMEAMAAGLPVVSTAVGGVPELVDGEHTGLLVRPDDLEGFAASIDRLATDLPLRRKMAEASRNKAIAKFGVKTMAESYAELYIRLLGNGNVGPEISHAGTGEQSLTTHR